MKEEEREDTSETNEPDDSPEIDTDKPDPNESLPDLYREEGEEDAAKYVEEDDEKK